MTVVRAQAPFFLPLSDSIAPENGSGSATFTRATAAQIFDNDGKAIIVPSGAVRMGGWRMVRNLFGNSVDLTGWTNSTAGTGSITAKTVESVTLHNGSIGDVTRLSLSLGGGTTTGDIARIYKAGGVAVNRRATESFYIKTADGSSKSLKLWWGSSGTTVDVDGAWQRVQYNGESATDNTAYLGLRGGQSPATSNSIDIYIWGAQLEDVTGQADQTASEYVSVGVESAPYYHGAGADGVKWFNTNKAGAAIPEGDLLGAYIDPIARTNNMLYCRDFTNAAWAKTSITATKNQTGTDGLTSGCSLLECTSAGGTILQTITAAAVAASTGFRVKRHTGTGTIEITRDGGSNWTDITSKINGDTFTLCKIENTSVTNPSVGFRMGTVGDKIIVDAGINHTGAELSPMPIFTTSASVTVNAETLTYQTSGNFSDTAGTILATVTRDNWASSNGVAVGKAGSGLSTSSSNSGAQGLDGTNTVNGPSGTPSGTKIIGMRWSGSSLQAFSDSDFGTAGSYDGAFGLSTIGIMPGISGYIKDVAIWPSSLPDEDMISAAESIVFNLVNGSAAALSLSAQNGLEIIGRTIDADIAAIELNSETGLVLLDDSPRSAVSISATLANQTITARL